MTGLKATYKTKRRRETHELHGTNRRVTEALFWVEEAVDRFEKFFHSQFEQSRLEKV
jgi:hypothetical protein